MATTISSPPPSTIQKDHKPKKPRSAYIFFGDHLRPTLERGISGPQQIRFIASQWKLLTEKDKIPFQTKASADKARYKAEMALYVPPPPGTVSTKKRKRKRDPHAPKRARSSYIFFVSDTRSQVAQESPELKNTEIITELGKRWRNLSERERQPYQARQVQDKQRYLDEMAHYTPTV